MGGDDRAHASCRGAGAVGGVTFVVVVNPGLFATDGVLSVDVWNACATRHPR